MLLDRDNAPLNYATPATNASQRQSTGGRVLSLLSGLLLVCIGSCILVAIGMLFLIDESALRLARQVIALVLLLPAALCTAVGTLQVFVMARSLLGLAQRSIWCDTLWEWLHQ